MAQPQPAATALPDLLIPRFKRYKHRNRTHRESWTSGLQKKPEAKRSASGFFYHKYASVAADSVIAAARAHVHFSP